MTQPTETQQDTQPQELLRSRCKAGHLTITTTQIRMGRAGIGGYGALLQVMPRANLTSVTRENRGLSNTLIFVGRGGAVIKAETMNGKDAQRALELLGYA
jgi:hypothetical protein